MREELRRIQRLTAVRVRKLHESQLRLAEADREAAALKQLVAEAESAWQKSVAEANALSSTDAGEFAFVREYVAAERKRFEACQRRQREAMDERELRYQAVLEAHKGVRQMESWTENVKAAGRLEEDRLDRISNDEIGARLVGLSR